MSIPRSFAIRRARGDAFTLAPAEGITGAGFGGSGAGTGAGAAAGASAAAGVVGAPLDPPPPMRAITAPIGSVSPSAATISSTPSLSAS